MTSNWIAIEQEGSVDSNIYFCDTAEEIAEAEKALAAAGLKEAAVWTGEGPDSVKTSLKVFAAAE